MLKVMIPYLFFIFLIINFEVESVPSAAMEFTKNHECNTTYDCLDFRMVCLKKTCECAKFHDWEQDSKKCLVNISRIFNWLRATMSTEEGIVFQQEDFETVEYGGSTILVPKWIEYETQKETGLSHVTRVIWPILLGFFLILLVYGAILLEFL